MPHSLSFSTLKSSALVQTHLLGNFTGLTMASLVEVLVSACCYGSGFVITVVERIALVSCACFLALGGSIVGTIFGAINGQSRGLGFFNGAGIGAITGAFVAIQLLESAVEGPSLSKVHLLSSLVNENSFVEYWMVESMQRELSDAGEDSGFDGLSKTFLQIQKLPVFEFQTCRPKNESESNVFCCSICLEELEDGQTARSLPECGHFFHINCIDRWLHLSGSCPTCRNIIPIHLSITPST